VRKKQKPVREAKIKRRKTKWSREKREEVPNNDEGIRTMEEAESEQRLENQPSHSYMDYEESLASPGHVFTDTHVSLYQCDNFSHLSGLTRWMRVLRK
jgi:hypothetical protein